MFQQLIATKSNYSYILLIILFIIVFVLIVDMKITHFNGFFFVKVEDIKIIFIFWVVVIESTCIFGFFSTRNNLITKEQNFLQ